MEFSVFGVLIVVFLIERLLVALKQAVVKMKR